MSQQHADTLTHSRADIDEALFSGQHAFRLPPDVPDLPPAPPLPNPLDDDMLARTILSAQGYETESPGIAVQCGEASYQLTDLAPGVFELRPPTASLSSTPEQQQEEPRPAVYEVPPPLELTLASSGLLAVQAGESVWLSNEQINVSGAEPAVIDLMLLSPPVQGTLLRDGFALTGGDMFTQEDILAGRIAYRHDGDVVCEDGFSFGTPGGEIGPATVRIRIEPPPHQAPVIEGPGTLGDVIEGQLVSAILGLAGGMAIVSAGGRGHWEQRLDEDWVSIGEVTHGKALLLSGEASLRFVPRKGWAGRATLTYRAWDGSTGTPGERVNLAGRTSVGGSTAYSANAVTVEAIIEPPPEEDRPLPPAPWAAQPAANDLTGDGVAVVRLQGEGEWQFSIDGGRTWRGLGPVYHGNARVLRPIDKVRFIPRKGHGGRVSLSGRPWDGRGAAAGSTVCLASRESVGDETPFGETVQTWAWHLDAG